MVGRDIGLILQDNKIQLEENLVVWMVGLHNAGKHLGDSIF